MVQTHFKLKPSLFIKSEKEECIYHGKSNVIELSIQSGYRDKITLSMGISLT